MNLWHFRSRNYRADWVMAIVYFGLVASLFPLCGIYADYEAFNPGHDFGLLIIWSVRKVTSLMWRVVTSENVSLLWSCVVLFGAIGLQSPDKKMHPFLRLSCAIIRKYHGIRSNKLYDFETTHLHFRGYRRWSCTHYGSSSLSLVCRKCHR